MGSACSVCIISAWTALCLTLHVYVVTNFCHYAISTVHTFTQMIKRICVLVHRLSVFTQIVIKAEGLMTVSKES